MRKANLAGVDKPVSRIVLGTGFVVQNADPAPYWETMDAAWEAGINAIDSGREYADGYSDACIGKWLQKTGKRDQVVLISKGCHHNAWRTRLTPFDLSADIFDSLAALQTDYIDVYMFHRDVPGTPVGPLMEALNAHHEAGRIRTFGASNWQYERIKEANDYAIGHGLKPFRVASQHFSLAEQVEDPWGGGCVSLTGRGQRSAREWYRRERMPLLAYSSLSMGLLSGRVAKDNFARLLGEGRLHEACGRAYGTPENLERVERAAVLAREKKVEVATLALAYVLNYQNVGGFPTFALVGSENPKEIRSSVVAAELSLSESEMKWLNLETETRS